ncbi:hypothetical protein [Buttiauxella gaviniae]|uniref:tail fiber/spike domain-containing protein n=1 Tax=Buttiauxella gaviniae TaxID=82990 RepID=UPI003C758162
MATTPTQLPVPSEKPQDLKFNAGKIDEFVTSMGWTYTDRFGNKHYTIEGLRQLAQQAISSFGYVTLKSFQLGAPLPSNELTLPNQVLLDEVTGEYYRWDGAFPKKVVAGSTPVTTGGIGKGLWLSVGSAVIGSWLDGAGDALVAVKQPISGSKNKTAHDKFAEIITAKDLENIDGDGVNDDSVGINAALPILAAANRLLVITPGVYLVNEDITFEDPVEVQFGAILKPRSGAQLTFKSHIHAGEYKIFDTTDDFYTSPVAVPSVKIAKGGVKPEWFGAGVVSSYDEISAAKDSSGAFMKAWRATTGEYTANVKPDYKQSEYMHSFIKLGCGKYRMDRPTFLGHTDFSPSTVRYNKSGGGVIGEGSGLSLLVYTDSEYSGNAFFTANDMSGEMHTFKGFKCVAYDPSKSDVAQYETKVGAMMLIGSADSITTSDLWAAGATTVVADDNGFGRGGVGIQFDSLVDHQFSDLLVEHCVHGIAFSSCVSTGNNIKGFANKISDLSFGNYIPDWPQMTAQTTKNTVSVFGVESKFCLNNSITFGTTDNMVNIQGVVVDGRAESSLAVVTNRVIGFGVGGGVSGTISGSARNMLLGLISDFGASFAGRDGGALRLNFDIESVTGSSSSENAVVVIDKSDSNIELSLGVKESVFPILRNKSTSFIASVHASEINLPVSGPSGTAAIISTGGNTSIIQLKISNSSSLSALAHVRDSILFLPSSSITPTRVITKGSGGEAKTATLNDFV